MSHDLMTKCEQKRPFKINDEKTWKWIEVDVSTLSSGEQTSVRCIHCHGRVRVHKQNVEHGPKDHVEHRTKQDSENCRGGHYFKGEHKMSHAPVA